MARLLDLGVEPYLVASSLLAVMAQRLVRRICPHCSRPVEPDERSLARWQLNPEDLAGRELRCGQGCNQCLDTGYHERVGLFELLEVGESVRDLIHDQAPAGRIKQQCLKQGMITLRRDGVEKALAGVTTLEEVARVTARDEGQQ